MNYFAHPTAVIDVPCQIGDNTKIWHFSHIMANSIIGKNCNLGQNVFVADGAVLGDNVKIQNNVSIFKGVVCEDDVFLGPCVAFTNVINPRSAISRKNEFRTTRVCKGASVGANATIVCGNSIGQYALVGAGAVVTHPVPDYALVMGNPARQEGWVSEYGHKLSFDSEGFAVCPESGQRYQLSNGSLKKL